jgi:hypothetical protein
MNKKAMELPINLVITIIIGIIIFGLGMGLFTQLSTNANNLQEDLNKRVKTGIATVECDNSEDWLCSPNYEMRDGNQETFGLYLTNRGNSDSFSISFQKDSNTIDNGGLIWK